MKKNFIALTLALVLCNAPIKVAAAVSPNNSLNLTTYAVISGDSLWKLSTTYKTSIDSIM